MDSTILERPFFRHTQLAAFLSLLLCAFSAFGQSTNIAIGGTTIQPSVKRLGINLGTLDNYDSGQISQNLITANPGFEGQIWNSTIRCAYGTATSCTDENQYAGWTGGFWNGATYEIFYGTAAGRSGTVTSSSAPGYGAGIILNFGDSGVAPSQGDYLILHKKISGNSAAGWNPYISGSGYIGDNLTDLPPGTLGKQTTVISAPTQNGFASLSNFFDSTSGKTFLQLNGTYQLQFKAKGIGGANQAYVQLTRYGVATYINQVVSLSGSWNTYTLTFSATESGTAIGTVGLSFSTLGATSYELDDVSLTKLNGDITNTSVFRDPVVNALRTLQPGVLRFWDSNGQLGETLDNLLAPAFGRGPAGYSPWYSANQIDYGLHDFLVLSQLVGAEPWIVVPTTFSTTDASNLIQYLGGSTSTVYGAKRAALGQSTPWTQVFSKIHLEFGNEAWNGTFKGGTIEYPAPYGGRATTIFGVMRANSAFVAASFDLVLGGQAASPGRNTDIQNACNNNDSFDIAPYAMGTVNSYSDNESLFGSTFAEPEAFMSSSSTASAEGLSPGLVYSNYQAIQASNHPVPLSFYEMNLSTLAGSITQSALNSYTPSLGAGLMVADTMLLGLKDYGIVNQGLFALPQYNFIRPDGESVLLWGSVLDMGVTDRRRPQYLALQLANQALSNGAAMLQTVHTGADPTWNQAMVNSVQFTGAHYLQSYAFSNGANLSAIIFNLSRGTWLPVTFSGSNQPSGTVQMQQLTSANVTDTNESSNVVAITPSTLTNFNPASGLTLPPYSMTVLTWTGQTSVPPVISSVASIGVTSTTATITWTTDQASTSQVKYGTSTSYGSSSALNSTLTTSHSVTLTGLTQGTTYNYSVTSAVSTGASSTSANFTFTTTMAAPVISAVKSSSVTSTSALVTWTTDESSSSQVKYGTTSSYGSTSALNSSLLTSHSVTLTGLTASTTYNYAVVSANSAGTSSSSNNYTFTTAAAPAGGNAPQISYFAYWGITASGLTISWSTDIASTTAVAYGTTSSLGQTTAVQTALSNTHGVTLTGLSPGTTYYFQGQSTSAGGVTGSSTIYSFTTISTGVTISNIVATGLSGNTAQISWTTSVPANSYVTFGPTTSYGRWSSTTSSTTSPSPSIGYVPSGTIHYQLISTDQYGNQTVSPDYTFVEP